MASIRIRAFSGLMPAIEPALLPHGNATVAHNCLLWDGSLRPMAQWVPITSYVSATDSVKSIVYDRASDLPLMYFSYDAVLVNEQPFSVNTVLGAGPASLVCRYAVGDGNNPKTVAVYPTGIGGSVSYTRAYLSNKPVNRLYGATRVRRTTDKAEEGTLTVLPNQDPSALIYEGDTATIQVTVSALDDETTHVRLYRTISGLDTGENITNEPDTNWHLIAELPVGSAAPSGYVVEYIDGGAATTDPLDVYYADEFFPPTIQARYFGLTEGGWFVTVGADGEIQVSERYLHHAWPTSNRLRVPYYVTAMAVSVDNVYLGTEGKPYVVSISYGEKPMQAAVRAYEEWYAARPNTMAPTPSGAMYCSNVGVVSLTRDGLQVITSGLANPGDVFYAYKWENGEKGEVRVDNASFAVYDSGWYYAFCDGPPREDFFYLTSKLYPIEAVESISSGPAGYENVQLTDVQPEYIQSRPFFVVAETRDILREYEGEPEALASQPFFVSAEFPAFLSTNEMDAEALDYSCAFVGGTLQSRLVTNEMAAEALDYSCTFVGGTLT